MSRDEYEKDMRDVAACIEKTLPDGIGAVIYTERDGEALDYFWDFRKMEIAG